MSKDRPLPRWRRTLWIAAGVLALFTVLGFFAVPPIVKAQLEKRASAALGRQVTVGKVRVNPYTVSLTLENLDVRLKAEDGSFLGWDRLYVNFDPLASLTGPWTVGAIELDGFHVTALLLPDGSFNFSDLIERFNALPATNPAQPVPPVRIGSLKVNGARVDFTDRSRPQPFATTLGPVSFAVTELQTTGARGAPYHFEAVTEAGEKLAWTGTLSAEPLASKGELRLENINLAKYAPYYAHLMRTDVVEGRLTMGGRYEINLSENQRRLLVEEGAVQLRGIKLLERANQAPVAEFPAVDVTGFTADGLTLKARIGAVTVAGGSLQVRRDADGSINLIKMMQSELSTTVKGTLPDVTIAELALKDFQVGVTDLAAPRPAQLGLSGLQVTLKDFTLADGAVMPLQLAMDWAPHGTVKVGGTVSLLPELKADLQVDVAALAILPLSPYLEQFVNARITQGTVTTQGTVQVALAGGVPAITFAGGVLVEKFGLVDGAHNEELAGFAALGLTGLKAATAPQLTVALAEVNVTAPYARVFVNADRSINLLDVLQPVVAAGVAPAAGTATGPAVPPAAGLPPKIEIGRVVIADGDFSLNDRSIEPNVRLAVSRFGGTITGLSSENLARGDVDLKAAVDGAGPIAITGKLDPFGRPRFADLKLDFKNVDLLPLSPYSGRYAGYELARGKLLLDIAVRLEDRKITANNVITLNQFTFGPPVESPDATGLPVRLGVALLKDTEGKIVIDVPVSGSLDDPSFRIGKVVVRVIINLLTKAAVSPFALLGSMFGGGGDELAYQEFTPGGSELLPAEIAKLDTMVKALANRPGLSVALEGGFDGPADGYVLKQQKVAALVRNKIWEERHAVDPNIPPPAQLEITAEAQALKVKQLFDEKFPPGTEFGAPLAAAPVAAAAPPKARKGFFGRVVDTVTLKGLRQGGAKPAEPAKTDAVPSPDAPATGLSLEEMTGRLSETMEVTDNDLRALAAARAQRVRDYFLAGDKVAADRIFLAQSNAPVKENKGPRVFLTLQ